MSTLPPLARNARITGTARQKLAEQLAVRYNRGQSIRELCSETATGSAVCAAC